MSTVSIRDARPADAEAIAAIYNAYIRDTVITFEVDELTVEQMEQRLASLAAKGLPWLVAADAGSGAVVGYAYAGLFKERAAYLHSLETSIYLDEAACGAGVGTTLFTELFARLRALRPGDSPHAPVHAIIGGIALPNDASVALHEKFGMVKVAEFPEVGRKFDSWIAVGYWQIVLSEK